MKRQAILAIGAAACLAACTGGKEPPSVRKLMKDEVQPTAEIFWNSSGSVSDESGEHDLTPTTEEGWKKARDAAAKLGEYGELMMTKDYAADRGEAWIKFSRGLVDISKRAEQAAANHDGDAMFEVGAYVYDVCSACHQAYPATEAAEENGAPEGEAS